MGDKSGIEWTEATWNPTVGCRKVSPGCKNCYAAVMHERLSLMGQVKYFNPFSHVRPYPEHLHLPERWSRGRRIFVNSMSDLFHDNVPLEYIQQVFEVMGRARQHTFQVLTKRSSRLVHVAGSLVWPSNVWIGVSVEDQRRASRAVDLAAIAPASVRFLSIEPLLGPIDRLPLDGIDWVICGGESGVKARPMDPAWAASIRDQCAAAGVPFFFKQLGGHPNKRGGDHALLDGRLWREYPMGYPV